MMFKQAVAAYKAGRRDEARTLLMEIVAEHEHHEQAWLLLSGLVDTLEEQQICLENAVALNPGNDSARKGLETVNQKIAARDKRAPGFAAPSSPQPPPASPVGAAPDDSGFGDPPWAAAPQQPSVPDSTFDDWPPFDSNAPPPDPFGAPATSVDWARSEGPSAHGSGKQVELPSNQEYDNWVQGLNLGVGSPEQDNLPPFQDDAPFGDTSFMIEADTNSFLTNQPSDSAPIDPFGRNELFANEPNPWGIDATPFADEADASNPSPLFPTSSSPSSSSPASPFSSPVVPAFEPSAGFGDEDLFAADAGGKTFVFEEAPGTSRFNFDAAADDGNEDDLWPDDAAVSPQGTAVPVFASKQGPVNVQTEAYFRYIPDEIEPKVGGIDMRSLLMLAGIAVLFVLNLVSFGALLM
jgi:hypothetical protein